MSVSNDPLRRAVDRRYGGQPTPPLPQAALNPVLETILGHRSVRRFAARPLPEHTLELIAAAAQSAPTSSSLQAMSIVAVTDPERKARLSVFAANQRQVADAPLLLMFVADLARLRQVSAVAGQPGGGLDYLECFIVAVADAAFAAQNALLALQSVGLGGCYIGAMRNHPAEVAAELGLPPDAFAVFGLTVGYPDPAVETGVKPRLAQSIVLHHERYTPPEPAAIEAYDQTMNDFRTDQSMTDIAWSRQVSGRLRDPSALMGRDTIAATLRSLGFGLK